MAIHRHQVGSIETLVDDRFYSDVVRGLSSKPKWLQAKYFYDETGDRLFQEIMRLPEYYLTNCEEEIFQGQTAALAAALSEGFDTFDILELGAGDATKSTHLLTHLRNEGKHFTYFPVDISDNVIRLLESQMPVRIPGLRVRGLQGEYFDMIKKSYEVSNNPKIVLFLGASIGNFKPHEAERFLLTLHAYLRPGDRVLVGFDLKKNPRQILAAYDDSHGITKAFNLNLLNRINRELHGNFILDQFDHYASYDPLSGACKSYLVSLKDQKVRVGNEIFRFGKNEPVWTEISQKYSPEDIDELARYCGFKKVNDFFDNRQWFMDAVWEKK